MTALLLGPGLCAEPVKDGAMLGPLARYGLEGALPDINGKVVLVDIWASWCTPCARSFPMLDKLYAELGPSGFIVLGISVDEKREEMEKFLKRIPVTFPVLRDAGHKLAAAVNCQAMPTSVLLDKTGRVRHRYRGFHGKATLDAMRYDIQQLLKE